MCYRGRFGVEWSGRVLKVLVNMLNERSFLTVVGVEGQVVGTLPRTGSVHQTSTVRKWSLCEATGCSPVVAKHALSTAAYTRQFQKYWNGRPSLGAKDKAGCSNTSEIGE